jgi:hypothetical protein
VFADATEDTLVALYEQTGFPLIVHHDELAIL